MKPFFSSLTTRLRAVVSHRHDISPLATSWRPHGSASHLQLLESCILDKNLALGSQVHSRIVIAGLENDSFFATKLIALYSLCGDLSDAEAVFDRFPRCNVFLLNAMIRGYSSNGLNQEAIDLFHRKRREGIEPDSYALSCVFKACASLPDLRQGKELHRLAVESGLESDVFVSNSLISMYAKCGSLESGLDVFDGMPQRDIVSWNSIISACAMNGSDSEAAEKAREMFERGFEPDQVTVINLLTMSSTAEVVGEVHGYVLRRGFEPISMIRNALVSAYGRCGGVEEARRVFDSWTQRDKVTWNALISAYAQNGLFEESLQLLRDMRLSGFDVDVVTYSGIISSFSQDDLCDEAVGVFQELLNVGLKPDAIAVASILPAVSGIRCFGYCKEIHAYAYRQRLETDRRVGNALVSAYGMFGSIQSAERVFEAIQDRDVISWSSMVGGYVENQCFVQALDAFRQMVRAEMVEPNPITITSVLSACAGVCGLRPGKELHLWALKNSFDGQSFVGSALVDMYAKCGRIKDSRRAFDLMTDKNLVAYNVMIGGYAVHGLAEEALGIFRRLEEPDEVSFITALSACRHGGLVEDGIKIFDSMKALKVSPREGHYSCMVDLLARSGLIEQALDLVKTMPMEASTEIWGTLLGACKVHSNLNIGVYTGGRILESGSENSGYYVLLSNILADFGRWDDVEVMRKLMTEKGVKKNVGCSWIEVNKRAHFFVAKERAQHPEWESLFWLLGVLNEQMRAMSL